MRSARKILPITIILLALHGCSARGSSDTTPEATHTPESSGLFRLSSYGSDESYEDQSARVSPKKPWGDFTLSESAAGSSRTPWWARVLLWAPNRVLDLVDVFRVDVGVGPAVGGVIRFTKYGQVGYRMMSPLSVRVGAFGRKLPVVLERSNEFGAGPAFLESADRKVCKGELGLGADLFLVGAYGGICVEELLDFAAGIFFFDIMQDDIR